MKAIDTILEKLEKKEIDMFQARKRLINLYKKDVLNARLEGFIKSENLEPKSKLELNRWIMDETDEEWMIYLDGEESWFYGVDSNGDWIPRESDCLSNISGLKLYNAHSKYRYATDEEILERLSKIAVKMGYKERQSECFYTLGSEVYIDFNNSSFEVDGNGYFWILNNGRGDGNMIFKDGKWAKFIETDTERIERLEKRVKELENKNK